jgi:outer membrane protein TolC
MVTWLVVGLAWAAPQTIALEDILSAAGDLSNTPYAAQIRADAAQARLTQARSPDDLSLRLMEARITPTTTRPSTEVRVRMPTEGFGLLKARANLARATDEVEDWEAAAYRLEAQATAHLSFVQLQSCRAQIAVLEEELVAHEQRVALFEKRLASALTTTDVHAEALGDQLGAQRAHFRLQAEAAQLLAQLAIWTRLELDEETELVGQPVEAFAAAQLGAVDTYLSELENHPLLRHGQAVVQASEAKRKEEAKEAMPSIRYVQADAAFESGQAPEISAMLGVDLPLFAGARADVSMARVESAKAQSYVQQLTHQLQREITGSWHTASALQQLWTRVEEHAERLEQTLQEMTQAGDPVAVADLRVRALRAQRRAQEDLARYVEARLDLDYTAGASHAAPPSAGSP